MFSRIVSRTHLCLTHLHSHPPLSRIPNYDPLFRPQQRHFSSDGNERNPGSDIWKIEEQLESKRPASWVLGESDAGVDEWATEVDEGSETRRRKSDVDPWRLGAEEKLEDVFGIHNTNNNNNTTNNTNKEDEERDMIVAAQSSLLENEQHSLLDIIQAPNRAFGDLIAASGITDAMLHSLIALNNFQHIQGLPPLTQIEDERYQNTLKKSSRHQIELQKQQDAAKARLRNLDHQGRAYGTGNRKCSIARVWIQPGQGIFSINDKQFDVYFPMLDHRAALLRPFSQTNTLGLWDVRCTVKGGGTTGQVDAIRLGLSRALQNWEPGLRPPLREAGFLTRDPRIVERKKPGKAKARKSFQWVKR